MEKEEVENKMGTMPVGKLMLNMGIPMVLSMMLQAVYNIVDSVFVANIEAAGEAALNGLTLAFPIQMLMVAIGIGTGVGMNVALSKSLGQGNREKASKIAGNAIFLGIIIYIVFFLFGVFGAATYIKTQTCNAEILELATDYLRICCVLSIGIIFFSMFEKMLQATGRSMFSTIAQITLFGLSGQTEKLCIQAMRLVSISFLFAGANIAFQGIFQALNSGLETLIISICRQFLFVLPVAYLLSLPARQNSEMTWLVWLTFPFAELLACIIAYIFMKRINKNKINL